MSDVTIRYNKDHVNQEQLVPLVDLLRPKIAELVDMTVDAILIEVTAPDYAVGYADIDVLILTTLDAEGKRDLISQQLTELVADITEQFVKDNNLSLVQSVGACARTANGAGLFRKVN